MSLESPIACGPLLDLHRRGGATVELNEGWQVAASYPQRATHDDNVLVDLSHWLTFEINGPETGATVTSLCGADVPLRTIYSEYSGHVYYDWHVYRLTPTRALVFGNVAEFARVRIANEARSRVTSSTDHMLDVTGGWASLALFGLDAERILNKVTAVDLRERTLPEQSCCQGPIFGVNTLFGRFIDRSINRSSGRFKELSIDRSIDRFDLHVCSDSAEFFWEVLMDAGAEFGLRPAGIEWIRSLRAIRMG